MSSRALRRLKGKQRGQEELSIDDLQLNESQTADLPEEEEEEEQCEAVLQPAKKNNRKAKKSKAQKNISNIYELASSLRITI